MTESTNTAATEAAPERNYRKTLRGIVVSDKMDKTIVVEIESHKKHALYGKIVRTTKRVKAHDEENTAGVGDRVDLMVTRPLSKSKRWRLAEIVERAQ
ncbi:30S ribosomal protein S17 [Auritidibacter ignavus]|uniref:30S ribosomal protein S17 n=1 Tax=Auritidibacter ignavus TaxID=678932 RepID=UPI002446C022|nr:30S ribosomal protein S17 [Auritidibacter ignavus]WGH86160.1 30S ribosomal protein S17 [Auritidibacter ignavus]WGH88444.1 30S ribosomal protein S17 [Auritidibacter ignavus]